MKKHFDDDNEGISLLNKRLRGEKLDNKVIDELMESEEDKKKNAKPQKNKSNKEKEEKQLNLRNEYDSDVIQQVIDDNDISDEDDEIINKVINNTYIIMSEEDNKEATTHTKPYNSIENQPQTITHQTTVQSGNTYENVTPVPNGNTSPMGPTEVPYVAPNQPNPYPVIQPTPQQPVVTQQLITQQPVVVQQPVNAPMTVEQKQYVERVAQRRKSKSGKLAKKIATKLLVWAIYIGIIAGFLWLISTYILGISKMGGDSMSPTYYDKETLIVDKITVNLNKVTVNDVIIFTKDDNKYVARVIAMQGDKVTIDENDNVYINNVLYTFQSKEDDNFFNENEKEVLADIPNVKTEYELGINEFFVYNDNKDITLDSRIDSIGIVTKNEIYGVVLVGFNFNK